MKIEELFEEKDAAFAKFAKKILPSGFEVYGKEASWRKKGGHAGANQLDKVIEKAEKLGFVDKSRSTSGSPDGSHVGSGTTLVHPDGYELTTSQSYGVTARDNWFSATLKT